MRSASSSVGRTGQFRSERSEGITALLPFARDGGSEEQGRTLKSASADRTRPCAARSRTHDALDEILELPNIAGIVVVDQAIHCRRGQCESLAMEECGIAVDKVLGQ